MNEKILKYYAVVIINIKLDIPAIYNAEKT